LNVEELHYWDRCVLGKIIVIRLPGDHNEMMKPPMVARTAALLQQALADWGQTGT
jgi:thioesterase domain-containing protein